MNIPVGFAQINIKFGGAGLANGAECTLGLDVSDFPGTALDLAEEVETALQNANDLFAATHNSIGVTSVLAKMGPNDVGPSAELATNILGTYGSSDYLPSASYLIRKNTALGGRQGRGRWYWPGVPLQDAGLTGLLLPNLVDTMNAGLSDFVGKLYADSVIPVLLSSPGSPIQIPRNINTMVCQGLIATQRRRLRP